MPEELFTFFEPRPRPKRESGHLRLLVLIGGCRSVLGPYCDLFDPDFLIAADVRRELEEFSLPPQITIPYALFALGRGETVATLFADASEPKQRAIRALPSVITDGGLNQIPEVAKQAGVKLAKTPDFQEALSRMLGFFRIACGGRPELFEIIAKGSVVGATNAGAAIPIIEEVRAEALRLSVPVEVRYDLTGNATFVGVDERGYLNVAVSVPHFIAETLRKGQDAKLLATAKVNLVELPPTFIDREARNRFVLADETAQASSELERHLSIGDPNEAVVDQMGAVSIREVDFGLHLDPETEVVPPIARAYHAQVHQALLQARSCRSLITEIESRRHSQPKLRETAEEIVDRVFELELADFLDAIRQPAEEVSYELTLKMVEDQEYRLDKFTSYFAQPAETLTETSSRLTVLRSQQTTLRDELGGINQRCDELREQLDQLEEEAAGLRERLYKLDERRVVFRRSSALAKGRQKLFEAIDEYRQVHDELIDQLALHVALSVGAQAVSVEEKLLSDELTQLAKALDLHILRGLADRGHCYVVPRPIDAVYRQLRGLSRLPIGKQRESLASHAGAVTMAGLARILRAPVPRSEAIVGQLSSGKMPIMGPPWGGKSRQDTPQVVLVLPTMKPEDAQQIRDLIAKHDKRLLVVFADSIRAVANVVRYRLYRVNTLKELYPESLRQELLDARTGPLAPLYDVENCPVLRQMGISIKDNRVHFNDTIELE